MNYASKYGIYIMEINFGSGGWFEAQIRSRQVHMTFLLDKAALGQFFLE